MPSKELEYVVLYLIKKYKHEIIRDRDWWHGIPEYFINVHDYLDKDTFNINIYTIGEDGYYDYSKWIDLPSLTLEELKAL